MKYKLLFWIDPGYVHYALAKFIQNNLDCDLFAIFEITDKPKHFFQNQKLVKFEKIWFLYDYILKRKHNLNLDYLKSVEQKYNIPLWLIASNDRMFNHFNQYYKFSTNEILAILEDEIKIFEIILDEVKPDFVIMAESYQQHSHIFYEMCRIRKIKILILSPAILPVLKTDNVHINFYHDFWYLTDEPDKFLPLPDASIPTHDTNDDNNKNFQTPDILSSKKQVDARFQDSLSKYTKAIFKYLFTTDTNVQSHFTYFGRTKIKVIFKMLLYELRKKQRENFMKRNLTQNIENDSHFIYFPLHQEQERVLLIGAPFYVNQFEVIQNIAKSLPIGYKLYVKDHPAMNHRGWRSVSEMKKIMKLHNVKLIHPFTDPDKLIEQSDLVISIKGSTVIHAAFHRKPSITFEKIGLCHLPSIHKLESISELPQAIKTSLRKNVNLDDLQKYLYYVRSQSFEFRYQTIRDGFEDMLKIGGYYANIEIESEKICSLLEKYKSELIFIASKYIERIRNQI